MQERYRLRREGSVFRKLPRDDRRTRSGLGVVLVSRSTGPETEKKFKVEDEWRNV